MSVSAVASANTINYPARPTSQPVARAAGLSSGSASSSSSSSTRGFSIWRALGNFASGLISPITSMFSSTTNFLLGAGMIIGGAALIIATGGAAAPILIGIGLGFAALQAGTGIYRLAAAENARQAEAAFHDFGAAFGTAGLSILGARGSLGPAGVSAQGMSRLGATVQCIRAIPTSFRLSANAFRSGAWRTNFSNFGSSSASFFRNLFTRRSNGRAPQTTKNNNGQAVDLPDSVLGTSYRRAQERLGLRVVADESLPQNVRAQTVSTTNNGARSTTIRVNRRTAEALRDLNHPQHQNAVRALHEELTHAHQTPINPVRANGSRMSVREYMARRALQEMVARSAASSKSGGPRLQAAITEINSLISQGKYARAITIARRNGLHLGGLRGYLRDYRTGIQSNGKVLVQRSNSTASVEEMVQGVDDLESLQTARELAATEGVNTEQFNPIAQRRITEWINNDEFYNLSRAQEISNAASEFGISTEALTQLMRARLTTLANRNGGHLSSDQLAAANRFGLRSEIEKLCAQIRATRASTVDTEGSPVAEIGSRAFNLLKSAEENPNTVTPSTLISLMKYFGFSWRYTKGGHSVVFSRGSARVSANTHNNGSNYVHPAGVRDCLSAIADVRAELGI